MMSDDADPAPGSPDPTPEPEGTPAPARRGGDPADAGWAAEVMRRNTRRTWLAPLLAVPIAQIAVEREIPGSFLPVGDLDLQVAREIAVNVLQAVDRVVASPDADLTDLEALDVLLLSLEYRTLLYQVVGFKGIIEELIGLPDGLSGEALVRRLARCVGERPEAPGRLAVFVSTLLEHLIAADRDYLPLPHSSFVEISRAFDRRCYALGLKTWADALRHASAMWTPPTWQGILMAHSAGAFKLVVQKLSTWDPPRPGAPSVAPRENRRSRRRAAREDPELVRLRDELESARKEAESARAEAALVRRREEELIRARGRAQAHAAELDARSGEMEDELEKTRRELRTALATLRRLQGPPIPEAPLPAPVAPPALPADLLRGKIVFLFSGEERAVAARLQAETLRTLGGEDVRVYDLHQGRPGPDVFPEGSIVVVDTRFVGHAHTEEIEARVRRSPPGVIFVPLRGGEGGLAARLAERLKG
jgi:hypothetical protein